MALQRCPECRKKISDSVTHCIHCGFSFKAKDLELCKQMLEQHCKDNWSLTAKAKQNTIFTTLYAHSLES